MDKWKVVDSRVVLDNPWLKVRSDHCITQTGVHIPDFYWIEGNSYIVVVGTTSDGYVVMEEQYRHGSKEIMHEFPAGLLEKDEDIIDAAKRELLEETGYTAEDLYLEKCLYPLAAISDKKGYIFFARNLVDTGNQHLEDTEYIKVKLVHIDELEKMVDDGIIQGGFAVACALLAARKRKWFLGLE